MRTYTRLVRHQSDVERFVFFRRNGETWAREWTGQSFLLDHPAFDMFGANCFFDYSGRLCVDMKVENLD